MAKKKHELVIRITNTSVRRLQDLSEWLGSTLEDWRDAGEPAMKGTDWEKTIDDREDG